MAVSESAGFGTSTTCYVRSDSWNRIFESLAHTGCARLPGAVPDSVLAVLASVEGREWRPLQDEGGVHQHGWGASNVALATAPPPVPEVAEALTASVTHVARQVRTPAPPPFNEVTWTRYPAGHGLITPHRDPADYGGLIAIFTLFGSAPFRVLEDASGSWSQWETMPGDVVLLASGWPHEDDRCPVHGAGVPVGDDRMIMTLRSNRKGPGAGHSLH